ncbi:hypothetical protein [Streptomyces flavofungini]|uniref:hypothetical protein n=1 Tax=Streptomyces flavofungini TaxID=68200 RepID=UPI0034DEA6AF
MGEEDPQRAGAGSGARVGRKFGAVHARSQEYEALAHFLRDRVREAGLSLRALEAPTGLGRAAISERLAGLKLDGAFVDAVVVACTQAPALAPRRKRLRGEGARLLRLAETRATAVLDLTGQPPGVKNVAVAAQALALEAQSKLLDLHEQLDRKNDELATLALAQQQSQLALRDADTLASVLSTWVLVLADEVERLGRERELAMTARPPDLARIGGMDSELARTLAQHGRTAAELAKAEQDRKLATALLAEALTRTRRVRADLRQLRATAQLPAEAGAAHGDPRAAQQARTITGEAFPDDVDAALDRAQAFGHGIDVRLRGVLNALDEDAETLPVPTGSATVTDNADNGVTGTDAADNGTARDALWWDMLARVPTEAFVWAERTAAALVRDRDPHDGRFGIVVTERPTREVLLLADRLQEHRWLEGAARLRTALALSAPTGELVPLILALLDAGTFLNRAEQGAQLLRSALAGRTVSDVLDLHNRLAHHDDCPPVVREGLAAIAQRSYADVVALVRRQLQDNPRPLTHGVLVESIVRNWPPDEVVALVREVVDIEDGYIVGQIFFALPIPPADEIALLVRLWAALPAHGWFAEMLPTRYPAGRGIDDLTTVIAELHAPWPPPLRGAAGELAAQIMPLIVGRTPLEHLGYIGEDLARRGLSREQILTPYTEPLVPAFMRPQNQGDPDAGSAVVPG